ncbi:CDP-alcohol phosphatidyltransferase family protein [archaeon]|nr:CDP-alcohol phosphatidyltransferase family protein [archaeon]
MKFVNFIKKKKDQFVNPIVKLLVKLGVSADIVTLVGTILGISASFFYGEKLFVFFGLAWIFLDVLDGSLARYNKKEIWWHDYVPDNIIFLSWLIGLKAFVSWGILLFTISLYLVTYGYSLSMKQRYTLIYPVYPAFVLFVFGFYLYGLYITILFSAISLTFLILAQLNLDFSKKIQSNSYNERIRKKFQKKK